MVLPPDAGRQAESPLGCLVVLPQVKAPTAAGMPVPGVSVNVPVAARLDRVSAAQQEAVAAGRVGRRGVQPEALVPEVAPVGAEEVDGGPSSGSS